MIPIRTLRAAAAALLIPLAACEDPGPTGAGDGTARVRMFNAVINLSTSRPGGAIDFLVDSSAAAPGVAGLATGTATEYAKTPAGVHRFEARLAGDVRPGGPANLFQFDARTALVSGFDYTVLAVGVAPEAGVPELDAVAPLVVVDDPFPPSRTPEGALRARLKLVNAAPYAGGNPSGATLRLILTPGSEPPPVSGATLAPAATVSYRAASPAVEVAAGSYVATVAQAGGRVIARANLTLAPGAARTLVVVSNAATTNPLPDNHRIVTLVDGDF